MHDVIVIGAGLFGSTIAAAFRKQGRGVLVIDDAREGAGSKPAACLMRPSWFSSLGKDVYEPALALLDDLYTVRDITFKVLRASVGVHWCDPAKILQPPTVKDSIRKLERFGSHWIARGKHLDYEAKLVVVAAGYWSPLLAAVDGGLVGQAGMACLWPGESIEEPFIKVWAPYKQITAFNRGDGLWAGDSNSVRVDRWGETDCAATERRVSEAVGATARPKRLFGIRPYTKEKPCYLKQPQKGLWVATGGAKNGTLAAGWCASQLIKE